MYSKINATNKNIVMGNQNLSSTSSRNQLLSTKSNLEINCRKTRGLIKREEQMRVTQLEQDMLLMMRRKDKLKANKQKARRMSYQVGVNTDELLLSLQRGNKDTVSDDEFLRLSSNGSIKRQQKKSIHFPAISVPRTPKTGSSTEEQGTFVTEKKKPDYVENYPDSVPLDMLPPIMLPSIMMANTRGGMTKMARNNNDYLSPKAVPRTRRKSVVVVPQYLPSVPKRFEKNEEFKKRVKGSDIQMESLKYCRYLRQRKPRRHVNKTST